METQSRILTDGEAAELLCMIPARLVRLAKAGKVPCVILPDGELRFDARDLWTWVAEHKRPVQAEASA